MEERKVRHLAIIMDGNGRWAKKRGRPRSFGHKRGIENIKKVSRMVKAKGIEILSLFAFSTENWKRPQQEVNFLMREFKNYLRREKKALIKERTHLNIMGSRRELDRELRDLIEEIDKATRQNSIFTLNLAFNYGGRQEIVEAARNICRDCLQGKLKVRDIDEALFKEHLYSSFMPDVDLMIRTSGEKRISNFLLWRLAYAELYFTPVYWPDFSQVHLDKALENYYRRQRRFGGV